MEKQKEIKRFTDEYPSGTQFEAEKIEVTEILGKDIVIRDIAELTGDYGIFLVVLADFQEKQVQFAIGSKVMMPKLIKAKKENKLPLIAKIVEKHGEKSKRLYYDLE